MSAPIYVRDLRQVSLVGTYDAHTHQRDLPLLAAVQFYTARRFCGYLVMPNVPSVDTADDLVCYRAKIDKINHYDSRPYMAFKVGPKTTPEIVAACAAAGAVAGKLYPDGVTTGSEGGVRDFRALWPVFAEMEKLDLVLCLHGEMPDEFVLRRELAFHGVVDDILTDFPRLRIVFEHITTAASVGFVRDRASCGARLAATITAHHLVHDLGDLIGGKVQVHLACQPTYKYPEDLRALMAAALSGESWFVFGSDTAPHLLRNKHCAHAACGVFSAPIALETIVELFDRHGGTLEALQAFVCHNGPRFYALNDLPQHSVELVRESWVFDSQQVVNLTGVVPWREDEGLTWRVTREIPLIG